MQKLFFLSLIGLLLFSSCVEDTCEATFTYQAYDPILKSRAELAADVRFTSSRALESPGKIYYYDNLILINERNEGVHIIDNSNKRSPQKLGFIEIEGNLDISFKGNYLYADTWSNILVIDIADIQRPDVVSIIEDVKPEVYETSPDQFVVGYRVTDVEQKIDCNNSNAGALWFVDNGRVFVDVAFSTSDVLTSMANTGSPAPSAGGSLDNARASEGQAGSMSRMALFGGHFYYVNEFQMHVFDVSNLSSPEKISEVYMEWGVETLFPYGTNLFVGANNGMHIYDNRDPSNPEYLSTFRHANACDPVVVQDDIAYVTLRDGSECQNFINQLDVVDVSNLKDPQLIASFPMHNPHGLSIREDVLYLCEGDQGLKVFDAEEPEEVGQRKIGEVKDYDAYDVISLSPTLLLMIGADGFYQFDTQNPEKPELLSSIKIGE